MTILLLHVSPSLLDLLLTLALLVCLYPILRKLEEIE